MAIEQQRSQEEEEKIQLLQLQRIQRAFNHDHGRLFRHTKDARVGSQENCTSGPSALVEDTIPAEVGKYSIVTNARARVQLESGVQLL